ncbi:membrane fusion protein, multidrug efflux system [Hymenobacter arizonensis]|uniref:Membrane fusion protein, multidrug efflux system n=1 Tax=Hymenobacter arizonensis TaxID=1227077 RepID=A0A1I6AIB0_HYMAR|nr:membrane fusion protein, multidrug efflux system [Hymenobacter arizonensis]
MPLAPSILRVLPPWLLVPLLCLGLGSCGSKEEADTSAEVEEARSLPVARLEARDTVLTRDYVAQIQAVRNVEIRARVPGFLEQIYVDEGQAVRKGQPLFRINDAEYKTRLARAQAALSTATAQARVARLELDRVKILTEKNIITKSELDVARANMRAAESRTDEARSTAKNAALQVSFTTVRAPFDGVVNREPLKVGSLLDNGTLLTTVSDTRQLYAYFNVSEMEYLEYTKTRRQSAKGGDVVRLVLVDGTLYTPPGKIETVESEFDASTGSIAFRARFDNPKKLLKHGATGKVRMSNEIENALLVPQKAVFEVQDKNYVYVVDQKGEVKRKSFVPQARVSAFYVVKEGLEAGDRVVCGGIQDLRDGNRITAQPVTMQSMLASAP